MARETNDDYLDRERELVAKQGKPAPPHCCDDHIEYVETDGALGQAWYCSACGKLLQVG